MECYFQTRSISENAYLVSDDDPECKSCTQAHVGVVPEVDNEESKWKEILSYLSKWSDFDKIL